MKESPMEKNVNHSRHFLVFFLSFRDKVCENNEKKQTHTHNMLYGP